MERVALRDDEAAVIVYMYADMSVQIIKYAVKCIYVCMYICMYVFWISAHLSIGSGVIWRTNEVRASRAATMLASTSRRKRLPPLYKE